MDMLKTVLERVERNFKEEESRLEVLTVEGEEKIKSLNETYLPDKNEFQKLKTEYLKAFRQLQDLEYDLVKESISIEYFDSHHRQLHAKIMALKTIMEKKKAKVQMHEKHIQDTEFIQ